MGFELLTIFAKLFILYVWQGCEYACNRSISDHCFALMGATIISIIDIVIVVVVVGKGGGTREGTTQCAKKNTEVPTKGGKRFKKKINRKPETAMQKKRMIKCSFDQFFELCCSSLLVFLLWENYKRFYEKSLDDYKNHLFG